MHDRAWRRGDGFHEGFGAHEGRDGRMGSAGLLGGGELGGELLESGGAVGGVEGVVVEGL